MNEAPETAVAWARVYAAMQRSYTKDLRQGTWYPVIRDDQPDRVTLRVGSRSATVPRRMVEVRPRPPGHFTVVTRRDAQPNFDGGPVKLGDRYLVCPKCTQRITLVGQPDARQCPGCGYAGDVGWWD